MRRVMVIIALVTGVVVVPAARSLAASPRSSDFNGDGIADLAVGSPFEHVGAFDGAGAVNILYGYPNGLRSLGDQFFTQETPGVPGDPSASGNFGTTFAAGDFNGDGFSDLAIAAPNEDAGAVTQAGVVVVLYGSATGLADDGAQLWTQDTLGVAGDGAHDGSSFGWSLAAGDLNGDGIADLAAGAPYEPVGTATRAGGVVVLLGSHAGLTSTSSEFWTQDSTGIQDTAETDDRFGRALAVANFGKSSVGDLAVGVSGEGVGSVPDAGAVNVLYGSPDGPTGVGDQLWTQDSPLVKGSSQTNDSFGDSLDAADFGKSGQADLAIGANGDKVGSTADAGAVNVLYGSSTGLTAAGNQRWTRASTGVKGPVQATDRFGVALGAANFGKSSQADLAIGAWNETVGTADGAGAVNVLYGSPAGLTATGNQFWTQDSPGIKNKAETNDHFGMAVAAANFGKSSQADLAVGAYHETVGPTEYGAVNVLYGSTTGLTATGNQLWNRTSPGVAGGGGSLGGGFGCALAPGSPCRD